LDVTTPETCSDADARVRELPTGSGRLSPPNPIFRDNPVDVYFEIVRPGAETTIDEGTEVRTYPNIQLAGHMSAVLVGEGFRIDPPPPSGEQNGGRPRQFGVGGSMIWRWNVTALDAPRHSLRVEVYVHIPIKNKDGQDEYRVTPVLTRRVNIPVQTTWSQKFSDFGTWISRSTSGVNLLTALVTALGALLAAWLALPHLRRRAKRRKAQSE
jgi:hypothetical protein